MEPESNVHLPELALHRPNRHVGEGYDEEACKPRERADASYNPPKVADAEEVANDLQRSAWSGMHCTLRFLYYQTRHLDT